MRTHLRGILFGVVMLTGCSAPGLDDPFGVDITILDDDAFPIAGTRIRFEIAAPQESDVTWSFGDGAIANGRVVEHAYGEAGRYHVEVQAGPIHRERYANIALKQVVEGAAPLLPPTPDAAAPSASRHSFPVRPQAALLKVEVDATGTNAFGTLDIALIDAEGRIVEHAEGSPPVRLERVEIAEGTYELALWTNDSPGTEYVGELIVLYGPPLGP